MTDASTSGEPIAVDITTSDITITAGKPDAAELAAVTAVLSAALEELADAHSEVTTPAPSAWARSQRAIRGQLHPGPGAWRSFN